MERYESMKNILIGAVEGQLGNLHDVDTEELGDVIDMIKDLNESEYYCAKTKYYKTVTKAMEEAEKGDHEEKYRGRTYYYTERVVPYPSTGGNNYDRMSYPRENEGMTRNHEGDYGSRRFENDQYRSENYMGRMQNRERERDSREGRAGTQRRSYMESKEMHHGKDDQMKELEKYMQELSNDVTEMIHDASPEEKTLLHKKLNALANKIELLNKD